MVVFPGCKINIGLNITSKRKDGYHNLESVFYPLGLSDILEIVPADHLEIETTGLPINGDHSDNLVIKAYYLLQNKYEIDPVRIHLHKIVPMGAGLGGGSADGAAALVVLNQLFDLDISVSQLEKYADELGSDCAFFIRNTPSYVEGKGEIIHPLKLDLEDYYIQLINPGVHISTQEAFGGISPSDANFHLKELMEYDPHKWEGRIKNDFESTVFPNHPEIEAIKTRLYENGAFYASMTGTGSSVYGLFEKKPEKTFPNYFEWVSPL